MKWGEQMAARQFLDSLPERLYLCCDVWRVPGTEAPHVCRRSLRIFNHVDMIRYLSSNLAWQHRGFKSTDFFRLWHERDSVSFWAGRNAISSLPGTAWAWFCLFRPTPVESQNFSPDPSDFKAEVKKIFYWFWLLKKLCCIWRNITPESDNSSAEVKI